MPPRFRDYSSIRSHLETTFPGLKKSGWRVSSPLDTSYQCIAWAACHVTIKWWPPGSPPESFWPPNLPNDESVATFVRTFETIFGYECCDSSAFEFGYQKVAIYATSDGNATHMARQHLLGRGWLSKLGDFEDIVHPDLSDIEGSTDPALEEYGVVVQVMKRSIWIALRKECLKRSIRAALRHALYRLRKPEWCGKKLF